MNLLDIVVTFDAFHLEDEADLGHALPLNLGYVVLEYSTTMN